MTTTARSIVMRSYGEPDVLRLESTPLAPLHPGEIRIRTLAAAVNHSDLEIRAGNWPIRRQPPFPYVPGLEVIGVVDALGEGVGDLASGDRVMTMMQGLGGVRAERPGGYAEFVTVAAAAVARVPGGVDARDMAALGLAAVTAHGGLEKVGSLDGRRILITGAAGGVGSAAIGVARAQGATVVALINRPEHHDYVRGLGASEVVLGADLDRGGLPANSIDGVLDSVGGAAFSTYVAAVRHGGTLSLVGAVGGSQVSFDAYRLMDVALTGYTSEDLDGGSLRAAIGDLAGWLTNGTLEVPDYTVMPLESAADAHDRIERRAITGRVLLIP